MDSIEQYEALLKKWGYEDTSELKAQRKEARKLQAKKIAKFAKAIQQKVINKMPSVKLPFHKLAA